MGHKDQPILVVDDQAGVRRLIQEVFSEVGYRVLSAANGQEALALASAENPSLVLLDVKMPVMDGLETLRALKAADSATTIIMMTAVGDGEQMSEALHCGARACISKPFDIFTIRQLVLEALGQEGST